MKEDHFFSPVGDREKRGNIITLEDANHDCEKQDPPHYTIKAKKIWVLAPVEWGK
jgi:hypothetical protein